MNRFRARTALSAVALLGVLGGLPGLAACSSGTPSGSQAGSSSSAGAEHGRDGQPQPGPRVLARREGRPGLPAAQPVRPAHVAEPVPRQGCHAGVRGLRVHHGVPADHAEHAAGQAAARPGRQPGAAARRGRQPGRHQHRRRALLLAHARPGQPVELPDRLADRAEGDLEVVRHRRPDRAGPDRPHSRPVRDRPAGPGAQALPDPDGLLQCRAVRPGARRGDLRPAARSPQGGQPAVARVHLRAEPIEPRHAAVRRPARAAPSRSGRGSRAWSCSSPPGCPRSRT